MPLIFRYKKPLWLQVVHLLLGIFYAIFGFIIIFKRELGVISLVVFLAVELMFLGLANLFSIPYDKLRGKVLVILDLVFGCLLIILAILILIFPDWGANILIILTAFGLILQGVYTLFITIINEYLSKWGKMGSMILGVLPLVLAVIVIAFPNIALSGLVILLAISFIINGFGKILSSFKGYVQWETM